uniref:CC domain-containing protein n=1 Tax=Ascaris lumbricoides TaxID=6252 RepID=A0A0M3HYD9_ASCLU
MSKLLSILLASLILIANYVAESGNVIRAKRQSCGCYVPPSGCGCSSPQYVQQQTYQIPTQQYQYQSAQSYYQPAQQYYQPSQQYYDSSQQYYQTSQQNYQTSPQYYQQSYQPVSSYVPTQQYQPVSQGTVGCGGGSYVPTGCSCPSGYGVCSASYNRCCRKR